MMVMEAIGSAQPAPKGEPEAALPSPSSGSSGRRLCQDRPLTVKQETAHVKATPMGSLCHGLCTTISVLHLELLPTAPWDLPCPHWRGFLMATGLRVRPAGAASADAHPAWLPGAGGAGGGCASDSGRETVVEKSGEGRRRRTGEGRGRQRERNSFLLK